jgi:hypothetical protein
VTRWREELVLSGSARRGAGNEENHKLMEGTIPGGLSNVVVGAPDRERMPACLASWQPSAQRRTLVAPMPSKPPPLRARLMGRMRGAGLGRRGPRQSPDRLAAPRFGTMAAAFCRCCSGRRRR